MRPERIVSEVLARSPGPDVGDVMTHLAHIAASARKDGPPARMWPADKGPDQAPQQVYREHITNPDVHGLQQDFSITGHTKHLGVENGYTHGDQPEHA